MPVNFYIHIPPLLFLKIILIIPTNTPFLYTSAIFHLPPLALNHPNNLQQDFFPASAISPIQVASRDQGAREPCEEWHCFNLSRLPQSNNRVHNQSQKIGVLQVWQTIQSTFSHTLDLLPLLPYPSNTTTRAHITLDASCLTWFSS